MANGHGGRRPGAGRKAGSGWTTNTAMWRAAASAQALDVVGTERDPLGFVLGVVADTKIDVQTRLGAASIALPFLYPRLSSSHISGVHLAARVDASSEDVRQRLMDRLSRLAPPSLDGTADMPSAIQRENADAE
jgi:hypothetical protein